MKNQHETTMADTALSPEEPLAEWSDARLIAACLAGDEQAWKTLIERYSRLIYTIPLRFGFTKGVADEIFQETCLVLLEKLDTLQDRERLHPWLVTVTRRACIHHMRRTGKVETVALVETDKPTEGTLEGQVLRMEEERRVQEALEKLDPRCRTLIQELFFRDPPLTYEALAAELEMSLGSVGPTRARCLEKMRRKIVELEKGTE